MNALADLTVGGSIKRSDIGCRGFDLEQLDTARLHIDKWWLYILESKLRCLILLHRLPEVELHKLISLICRGHGIIVQLYFSEQGLQLSYLLILVTSSGGFTYSSLIMLLERILGLFGVYGRSAPIGFG